jgi:hypothetical protein
MSAYISCVKNSVSNADYTEALSITNLASSRDPRAVLLLEFMVEEMPRFDTTSVMKVRGGEGTRSR